MKQIFNKRRKVQAGFTLIEILVVMAIIGILMAIAVPSLIIALQHSKENASAANAKDLGLACFNYSSENGAYPSGATSTAAFLSLYPAYLQDAKSVYLNQAGGHTQFSGASLATLSAQNVCWTITVNGTVGLTGADPTNLPLLLSDLGTGYPSFPNAVSTTVTPGSTNIWGLDGVTVARLDQSTSFVRPQNGTMSVVLTPASFACSATANYKSQAP